jgi:hypothetical protein
MVTIDRSAMFLNYYIKENSCNKDNKDEYLERNYCRKYSGTQIIEINF